MGKTQRTEKRKRLAVLREASTGAIKRELIKRWIEEDDHPYAEATVLLAKGLQWAWETDHRETRMLLQEKIRYLTRTDHYIGWNDGIDVIVDTMRTQLKEVLDQLKQVDPLAIEPKDWLEDLSTLASRTYHMAI